MELREDNFIFLYGKTLILVIIALCVDGKVNVQYSLIH